MIFGAPKKRPLAKKVVAPTQAPVAVDPVAAEIRRGVLPTLTALHTSASRRDPGTAGRLVLKWTVLPDGRVRDLYVQDATVASEPFKRSVAALIAHWRFPSGGEVREVVYPFVFA